MMLVDAHAHLHLYSPPELPAVLGELDALGAHTMAVSVDPDSYRATRALAGGREAIVPAFGVHPEEAPRFVDRLHLLTEASAAPAIGEVGLDRRWVTAPDAHRAQRVVFDHLLAVAAEGDKVVNLHTAGAEHDVAAALATHGNRRAIVHWYSGPFDAFERLVELGCYFTFGPQTFLSGHIAELARRTPSDRLLTETDNPGGPEWLGLGRGRPGLLPRIVAELARLLSVEEDALTAQIYGNYRRVLGK